MENKVELKKFIGKVLWISFCVVCFFLVINVVEYRKYTKNFNAKISNIVEALQNKYPQLTESEIISILNSKGKDDEKTLKKYGILLNDKAIVLENDTVYYQFLLLNLSLLSLGIFLFVFWMIRYLKKKEKEINNITKYIEQINQKNYSLEIDFNSEDELSILKNEIYKTTVMLKEAADNSNKDKKNLKESLEDISHQLKTPLTSILIMIDNLMEDPNMDKSTREDFLKDMKRNVTNIHFLVQSILKLSKFEVNAIHFTKENRLLKDIIEQANKNVSTLCDLKNIKVNIKGESDATIFCDFMWQVEAITNIIKNSVEHSHLNSQIDILYEKNNAYSKIIIKDYGLGIDKEELHHIFERFYKGKNSSIDSIGIGLSLAKTIIEHDNGVIDVESQQTGTQFIIKYFNL